NGYGWDDGTSQWVLGSKTENTYDPNGNLNLSINYIWNTMTNQWDYSDKFENQYDTDQNLTVKTYSEWSSGWTHTKRDYFVYYVFKKVQTYYYDVCDGASDWGNFSKTDYLYVYDITHNINNLTKVTEYLWDVISVIYVNFRKADYKYDGDNNMFQCIFSKWVKQLQNFIFEA